MTSRPGAGPDRTRRGGRRPPGVRCSASTSAPLHAGRGAGAGGPVPWLRNAAARRTAASRARRAIRLFLEQLLRHAEEGAGSAVPGLGSKAWSRRGSTGSGPGRQGNALQAASVLGQRFDRDALAYRARRSLGDALGAARRRI